MVKLTAFRISSAYIEILGKKNLFFFFSSFFTTFWACATNANALKLELVLPGWYK